MTLPRMEKTYSQTGYGRNPNQPILEVAPAARRHQSKAGYHIQCDGKPGVSRIKRTPHPSWQGQLPASDSPPNQGWVARGVAPSGSRRTRRDSLPSPGSHHLDHQGILHPGPVREAAWVALLQPLPRRTGPAISPSTSALSYSSSPRTRRGLTRRNSHRWPSPFARLPLQELHRYYGPVRRRTDHARCAFPSSMREPQTRLMPPQCRTPLGQ